MCRPSHDEAHHCKLRSCSLYRHVRDRAPRACGHRGPAPAPAPPPPPAPAPPPQHVDVLIVGAGLSGIGAACHLSTKCPGKSYAILEAREAMGGTWDLFRYPGIRSDSDMFTLGFSFKPWVEGKAIADGPDILSYIHETAREYGVDDKIR